MDVLSLPTTTPAQNLAIPDRVRSKRMMFDKMTAALQKGANLRLVVPVHCRISTFWGDSMLVTLPEAVSSEIAMSGVYEAALTILLIQILEPGSVVFDIGAHRGYFTLLAAR